MQQKMNHYQQTRLALYCLRAIRKGIGDFSVWCNHIALTMESGALGGFLDLPHVRALVFSANAGEVGGALVEVRRRLAELREMHAARNWDAYGRRIGRALDWFAGTSWGGSLWALAAADTRGELVDNYRREVCDGEDHPACMVLRAVLSACAIKNDDIYSIFSGGDAARCKNCGDAFDGGSDGADDCRYCCEECAHEDGREQCEQCGEWIDSDDAIYTEDGYFCDSTCAHRAGWWFCDRCEEWERSSHEVITNDGGEQWCDDCIENNAHYSERRDEYVADDVYEEREVDDYHDGARQEFFPAGVMKWGIEFEIESRERGDLADWARDRGYRAERDGSLDDESGIEIITRPLDFGEVVEAAEAIRVAATQHDSRSHDGGACGFHVHVSRNGMRPAAWARLDGIYRRIERRLWKLSRRSGDGWCKRPAPLDRGADVHETPWTYQGDRYEAVNYHNTATVEFRGCRGSLAKNAVASWLYALRAVLSIAGEWAADGHGWAWIVRAPEDAIWREVLARIPDPGAWGYAVSRAGTPAQAVSPAPRKEIPAGVRTTIRNARKRAQHEARARAIA